MNLEHIPLAIRKKNKKYYSIRWEYYSHDDFAYSSHCCPLCEQTNWVYLGRMSSLDESTKEACRCWNCDHKFFIMDFSEIVKFYESELAEFDFDLQLLLDEITIWESKKEAPWR